MKLYQLSFDYAFALADVIESLDSSDSLELCPERPELIKCFKYGWIMKESTVVPDFVLIMSSLLGCKHRILGDVKNVTYNLNFTPVKISDDEYVVFSNLPILSDCINIKKSKVSRFSNGEIMEISNPVFYPKEYPALFKVKDIPSSYFCNEIFRDVIIDKQYTGLLFKECNIKSKSWF